VWVSGKHAYGMPDSGKWLDSDQGWLLDLNPCNPNPKWSTVCSH